MVQELDLLGEVGCYFGKASILSIIKAFIPVSTNCYWFISCYILLMIFSPYINRAIDSMSELQHRQLLLLMSAVFLVAPNISFARDCSVFIVIEAATLMMFFMKVEFHSDFINRVAKHVFAVYLFEGALRQIVQNIIFDYSMYEGEWYWPIVNIAVSLIAMVGCMSIDVLAQWILRPFRKAALKIIDDIINISQKIFICY